MQQLGERAELFCKASGYPSPKVTWKKQDGSQLPSGRSTESIVDGTLVIESMELQDEGKQKSFICKYIPLQASKRDTLLQEIISALLIMELEMSKVES